MKRTLSVKNKEIWTSELLTRSCPLCGSNDYEIISRTMKDGINLPTVICRDCTLVYTNPVPTEKLYNLFYEEAYNNYYIHQDKFVPTSKEIPGDVKQIIDIISKYLPDRNSRILEIGSGSGRLLYYLTMEYPNARGIEPGPNAKNAKEAFHLDIIDDFFEPYDFGKEKFDLIIMVHVLEQVKCRNLLKDNGYLFIEVPNILKPFRSLDHYFLRYVHPINYSPVTVKRFLAKHRFQTLYMDSAGIKGLTPKNIRLVAKKGNGESTPPVKENYLSVIRKLNLKRIEWILFKQIQFKIIGLLRLMKTGLAKSKVGELFKNLLH